MSKIITGTLEMEQGGSLRFELYPDIAPISVENFVKLAKDGFYDGLTFHRIVPGFVIQGGDPTGTDMGGPGWHITGEFASNGIRNDLKHTRGVLSWARSMDPNSAGSQFFIMVDDAPHLDGDYAGTLAPGDALRIERMPHKLTVCMPANPVPLSPLERMMTHPAIAAMREKIESLNGL